MAKDNLLFTFEHFRHWNRILLLQVDQLIYSILVVVATLFIMAPKSLDFSEEFSNYVPEDKDQRLVKTPYGKGIVIRTRNDDDQQGDVDKEAISMKEIELSDWTKPELKNGKDVSSFNSNSNKPHMLYTPIKFPSVSPVVGSEVLTQWGRGKVTEIREVSKVSYYFSPIFYRCNLKNSKTL